MISGSLLAYGEYQQAEIDFLLPFIDSDDVVYDIGANIGYHANAFASQAKTVYSFEAHPTHFDVLTANTDHLTNVIKENIAIGDVSGTVQVSNFDLNTQTNYGEVKINNSGISIPCKTIDSMNLPEPKLIKVDVEGQELEVIKGSIETIEKHLPMIYFESQDTSGLNEIYPLLSDLGYNLDWCVVRNYMPNNYYQNNINIFGNTAIFSILAHQPSLELEQWIPVTGPDDHWERLCQ